MRINKLILYNFNSYEGINEFDFTTNDKKKNIILIGGKNGAGKTSLFSAIKIALYGPLAFGYIGANSHYISKIKDCINTKAFQQETVNSKVQISISLMVEREIKEYEIAREWDYTKQKLEEKYSVKRNNHLLDEQELTYFQNYLRGMIPPDLFEFFLFDGEEVGNIFSTSTYNSYVKNAIYTLCNLDIFEIIRKYSAGYVGKASSEDEKELHKSFNELVEKESKLEKTIKSLDEKITEKNNSLAKIEIELEETETAFKTAGGITEKERKRLAKKFAEAEQQKAETTTRIKMFVEDLMPFYLVKEFNSEIEKQLDIEEKSEIYNYIQQKVRKQEIKEALNKKAEEDVVEDLLDYLLNTFKPDDFKEDSKPLYSLSHDEKSKVNYIISAISDYNSKAMIKTVESKQEASNTTAEINKLLKNSMTDEDSAQFAKKENELLKKKDKLIISLQRDNESLEEYKRELEEIRGLKDKSLQKIKDDAQNKHVFELSSGLSVMMKELLNKKAISIRCRLEQLIINNLKHIYRKNNLITHIEIDEDFSIKLYQDVVYSRTELSYLLHNLGNDAFLTEIGNRGFEILLEKYRAKSLKELKDKIEEGIDEKQIKLFKRIDLSRLSKGERQIFILSLYWAIIELSGQDIPFVIDTPYARIDANHRKEISEKFFPNISKQVIILSTDEEINEEYYEILKPNVAKEYLLINDESQNKTTVEKHYFFGE